jgi:HAD superfamily hydrolase (TIGR01484 family)
VTATRIRLLLADVDGTLVTQDKLLTDRAIAAVHHLHDAGVLFAITSGRPPRGMAMLVKPLSLQTPIAAFNGGLMVGPDMEVIEQRVIPQDLGRSHRRAAGIVRSGRVGLPRRGLVRP